MSMNSTKRKKLKLKNSTCPTCKKIVTDTHIVRVYTDDNGKLRYGKCREQS